MNVKRSQKRKIVTGIKLVAFIGLIVFAGVCVIGKYNYMYEARKAKANIDYGMQVNSVTAVKNELIKARKHLEKSQETLQFSGKQTKQAGIMSSINSIKK